MSNPLLEKYELPPFSLIQPEHLVPAIDYLIEENRRQLKTLLEGNDGPSWENIVHPMEVMEERLRRTTSTVSHMNAVVNSESLREAYNQCLPKLSHYYSELGQNESLFRAFRQLQRSADFPALNSAQQRVIENQLRDFRLSGVALDDEKKAQFKKISAELSQLGSQFNDNVLDATNSWNVVIKDKQRLAGIPETALSAARQAAQSKGQEGWLFNLEYPSYLSVITFAEDPQLRESIYRAYHTRASDQGPDAGRWDNSEIMATILDLRKQQAQLLGYDNYAALSLATKMASTTDEVLGFLQDLAERASPLAQEEFVELEQFAKQQGIVGGLQAWDVPFYSEQLRRLKFDLSQEDLRPYFPVNQVLEGLFQLTERLFGLRIERQSDVDLWHQDARFYRITDGQGATLAQFYLDLFARDNKRGGAWMDECVIRWHDGNKIQLPVAYLVCNFSGPVGEAPALLTHNEVLTLFHEFGHGLHHMMTGMEALGVSGINGVPWDAVELPSQFMENWCWQSEVLALISGHYQTGEPLPQELFAKMKAAKNFQSGMQMMRQLEFALFDFRLHIEYQQGGAPAIQQLLDDVRDKIAVVQVPEFNRFQHGFSHIFAGGYAAGYYSYKWAEVLSADAFAVFEEQGLFNPQVANAFRDNILQAGGSAEPTELFARFRGRPPSVDALLRQCGIEC